MPTRKYNAQPWGHYIPHLEEWRRYRVLSAIELAAMAGVSNSFIGHLEAGRKRAAPETIGRIADALGVTREQLIRTRPPQHDDAA